MNYGFIQNCNIYLQGHAVNMFKHTTVTSFLRPTNVLTMQKVLLPITMIDCCACIPADLGRGRLQHPQHLLIVFSYWFPLTNHFCFKGRPDEA